MKQLKHLARYVSEFRLEDAPAAVIEAAKACILDTLSVALGARENPLYQSVKATYLRFDDHAPGTCSIWGSPERALLRTAVFLNAAAGHTLELDDVHTGSKTHIGTVVVPAAWTAAEYLGKSGRDLLEAVICAYEVTARIGAGFGVSSHRNKGWHVTGTAGTFGSAAACGKLFGFTPDQMVAAFGLAGTQSCSTWAFLTGGATNKVLHPARAAVSGLESCLLVLAGMKGTSHILDAQDGGIFPMMSDAFDYDLVDHDLGTVFEILNVDKKPYPCCRSTHCAIDAAIALRKAHNLTADQVDHVVVDTYLVGYKQCGLSAGSLKPVLPTEAKFSTPYVTACALINGRVGLDDFLPEAIADPDRQDLLSRVHVQEAPAYTVQYPAHWGCGMTLYTKDQRTYHLHVEDASGSVGMPLNREQLIAKARTCCSRYSAEWLDALIRVIFDLEHAPVLPVLAQETGCRD